MKKVELHIWSKEQKRNIGVIKSDCDILIAINSNINHCTWLVNHNIKSKQNKCKTKNPNVQQQTLNCSARTPYHTTRSGIHVCIADIQTYINAQKIHYIPTYTFNETVSWFTATENIYVYSSNNKISGKC